jgi:hypothetical protein
LAAVTFWARFSRALPILFLLLAASALQAAEQRYDYDPLGRLIRAVGDGTAVEYAYDPAGNLLSVASGEIQPPVISSGHLGDFRQNTFREVVVNGERLSNISIRATHPGIRFDNLVVSHTSLSFKLSVAPDVPVGAHQLVFENASGTATVGLNVLPAWRVVVDPQPIAVPPDSVARKFFVRLAEPETQDLTFSLATLVPTIAKSLATSVTIPAGATTAEIGVIGVANGTTVLRLSHTSFIIPIESHVIVSAGAGSQTHFSRPVGIIRLVPWAISSDIHTLSKSVGIVRIVPWVYAPDAVTTTTGRSVGIIRGGPYDHAAESLVVSPPVGVSRP